MIAALGIATYSKGGNGLTIITEPIEGIPKVKGAILDSGFNGSVVKCSLTTWLGGL